MNPIAQIFEKIVAYTPHKAAVISNHGRLSYAELQERVLAWANFLEPYAIRSGDLVGLHIQNEVQHFEIALALLWVGARHVTLASHDSPALHQQLIAILKPKAILTDSGAQWTDSDSAVIDIPAALDPSALPKTGSGAENRARDPSPAGSVLLKTSGTTGGINIIELSASDLVFQSQRHPEYAQDGLLRFASIEHNNSKRHRLYAFLNGGLNVFGGITDDTWLAPLASGELKILDISRLHILDLLHRFPDGFGPELKIRTGGSAIPMPLRRAVLDTLTPHLFVRYATTEFGGIAMADPTMHDVPGCVGRPLPGVEVQIVNDAGTSLGPGEVGRIRVQAAGAARAYLYSTTPSHAAAKFDAAYFYPGDVGYLDEQGRLIVSGRQDDMIIMNGLNIFPDEVQTELDALPGVVESVCFPVPSLQHGQIPAAAVRLAPKCSHSEADLIRMARASLALKAPKRIFIVDALPVNSAGKHDRAALRAQLGL